MKGTHDPGAGLRLREGLWPTISQSIVFGAYAAERLEGEHWGVRVDDTVATNGFLAGNASLSDTVFAAVTKSSKTIDGQAVDAWLELNSNTLFADIDGVIDPTQLADTNLILFSSDNRYHSVPVAEVVVNDESLPALIVDTPALGAVTAVDDWAAGWAFGLDQTFWFQAP